MDNIMRPQIRMLWFMAPSRPPAEYQLNVPPSTWRPKDYRSLVDQTPAWVTLDWGARESRQVYCEVFDNEETFVFHQLNCHMANIQEDRTFSDRADECYRLRIALHKVCTGGSTVKRSEALHQEIGSSLPLLQDISRKPTILLQ